jgi:hypothetical protein
MMPPRKRGYRNLGSVLASDDDLGLSSEESMMPPRKRAYRNLARSGPTRTATLWTTTISGTTTLWTTTTSRLVSKTRSSTLKTIYLIQSNEKN